MGSVNPGRVESLRERHEKLDEAIHEEQNRPLGCGIKIKDLKRQKLRVKEELGRYAGAV